MRGKLMLGAGLAAAAAVAFVAGGVVAAPDIAGPMTVHVIEHAKTDTFIDVKDDGDSTGDLLTFHNPVFDATDSTRVGGDQGECTRIVTGRSFECTWITHLAGGSITVEGPFFDTHDSVVAVTGGTGLYRNARGSMTLRARAGGTEFDFIFHLIA
jgi:allene oxide cyclase